MEQHRQGISGAITFPAMRPPPPNPVARPKPRPTFLAKWRAHRGLSQEELADKIGQTQGMISQLENGHSNYTGETLELLARALDCEPWELLARDPTTADEVTDELWAAWPGLTDEQRAAVVGMVKSIKGGSGG